MHSDGLNPLYFVISLLICSCRLGALAHFNSNDGKNLTAMR